MHSPRLPIALLAAAALCTGGAASAAPRADAAHPGKQLRSLTRQLAAATLVARLGLTKQQRTSMLDIIGRARDLRSRAKTDPSVESARSSLEKALGSAITEVHDHGLVSPETRQQIGQARRALKQARRGVGGQMKGLLAQLRGVLSPAQIQAIRQMRPGRRGMRGMRGRPLPPRMRKARRRRMKRRLAKLLLSDEMLAELGR